MGSFNTQIYHTSHENLEHTVVLKFNKLLLWCFYSLEIQDLQKVLPNFNF